MTLIQVKAVNGGQGASQAIQFTSLVTAGDTIIVTVRWYIDPLVVGISDSEGNAYQLISSNVGDTNNVCQIWQAVNVAGDVSTPNTITITNTATGSGAYCRVNTLEYSPCQYPLSTPWARFTSVITPNTHDLNGGSAWSGNQCGPVLYETGSQCGLGAGSIFKMWFQGSDDICYAESLDGVTWTRYTGTTNGVVIAGYGSMRIWKESGTYYLFCSPYFTDNQHIYLFTSTDGVTWAPQGTILAAAGGWEGTFFHFCVIDKVAGTYYALYDGYNTSTQYYATGLATATSLAGPWTKYSSNPVLANPVSGVAVTPTGAFLAKKIGSTYYIWFQSLVPGNVGTYGNSDIYQATSTDLIHFTLSQSTPVFNRMLLSEGAGQWNGQVADASIVEVTGKTYVWYTATPNGYVGKNYTINHTTISESLSTILATPVVEILPQMTYGTTTAVTPASIITTAEAAVVMTEFTFNSQSAAATAGGGGTLETYTPSSFDTAVFDDIGGANTYSLTATLATSGSNSQSIQLPFYPPTKLATPTFAISDGATNITQQVTITLDADATSTYYTLDGSTPTPASTLYSGPFNITTGETITAYSVAAGYTDSADGAVTYAQQAAPTFSPVAGLYGPTQSVSITSASATEVYYEVGSSPYPGHETLYTTQVSVASSETVYARAARTGYVNSAVSSAAYTINGAQATPTFSPVAGSYGPTQSVTITSTGADAIYYTTDGSTPTTGSTLYVGMVSVATSETLKALAVKAGWSNSSIGSAAYTINGAVATPTFSPAAGTYTGTQNVTVSNANSGLSGFAMYYTTDGSTPTVASALYTGAIPVSTSETIKVLAVATGYSNSTVGSAAYIISLVPTYSISGNVGVASATIYYTGVSSGSTMADSSGNYSITGLANGLYTITPSKAGYTFSPVSENETVNNANITGVTFLPTQLPGVYIISGFVLGTTSYKNGNPVPPVFANDVKWKPTPAHFGNLITLPYIFGNPVQWTPSPVHFGNKTLGGAAMVTLSGAASGTTTTDELEWYEFTGLAAGTYTITPSKAGYVFAPESTTITIDDSVNGIDFGSC